MRPSLLVRSIVVFISLFSVSQALSQATQILIETAANGSGTVVPPQTLTAGSSITVYAITRTAGGAFVSNVAADSITLQNVTSGVAAGDLVVAANKKSAVFTAHVAGSAQIIALSGLLQQVSSGTITTVAGPASLFSITAGNGQSAQIRKTFSTNFKITVRDAYTNPVNGKTVTFIPPTAGASGGFTGGVNTAVTNASGVATAANFTANDTAGSYTLGISVTGATGPAGVTLTNLPGSPASISVVAGSGQSAALNTPFAINLRVIVRDSGSNPVPGVLATFTTPVSGASGTFAGNLNTATTDSTGNAVAAVFTGNTTPGGYIVGATVSGVSTPANFVLTNTTSASRLKIQTQPSTTAMAGVAFNIQPVIRIEDQYGNLISSDNSTVVTAERLGGSGTLQGTLTATSVGGVASFSNLFHTVANTITLRFTTSSPVLQPDTSTSTIINPSTASKLGFIQQPTNATSSMTISPAITVQVQDAFGNNVSTIGVSVAMSLSSGTGTLSGTTTRTTNATGLATFNDLSINLAGNKNLTASATSLSSAISSMFVISIGSAAAIVSTAGTPQSTVVNTPFATNLEATVRDAGGNPVNGAVVTFTSPVSGPSGNFSGGVNTATTNASGVATSVAYTANTIAGSFSVAATVSGVGTPATYSLTNIAGAVSNISATAGTPQSAQVGTTFTTNLQATVRDTFNNPISGAVVIFTPPGSGAGGTFASGINTATTNTSGIATAQVFSANTIAGTYAVSATASGVATPATFSLTNVAGTPASIVPTGGTPQSTQIGTGFLALLQATVRDASNNPVNGATVTFTAPSTGASGTFANGTPSTTATTNASGVATASAFAANLTAGSYGVAGTVSGVATPATFSLTNNPGPPATIVSTAGTPQSAQVNTTFATVFQATVKDAGNNPLSGVTVTFNAPTSGARGTFLGGLSTVTATTNTSGVVTAPGFTAGTVAGSYSVTGSVAGVATPATFSLTNTAGVPAAISPTAGTPQSTQVTTLFGTNLQVIVLDAFSNPDSGVVVTFSAPISGPTGTFASGINTAVTNASGIATSQPLTANSIAGPFTISATASGIATSANFSLTNTPGAPSSITAAAGTPQSVRVGTAFSTNLQALVKDAFNNPISGATVTFTGPTTGARGTFANSSNSTTSLSNLSGVATASIYTANTLAGAYAVTAAVSGVPTPANYSMTNAPGPAASIIASAGTPQSTQISTAFPANLQTTVRDAFGNPVPAVTVTFSAPSSGATGTFAGGNTATTNASGVATANVFVANFIAGSYVVNATASGVATSAPFNLTNTPGAPSSVSATAGTPQSAQVGTAFATNLQATVRDGANNPVPNVTVTFTAPTSGASGTFAGSVTTINVVTGLNGVASATVFTANLTAGSYALTASVVNVGSPANYSLTNSTGPPGSIAVVAGTPQSATVNSVFPTNLQVIVRDAANNPVPGVTVTFTRPANGASGTFTGNNNLAVTNSSGIATAQTFTANSIAGTYQVMASAPGVSTPAIFNLTNNPSTAAIILAIAGTPQSSQVGTAFPINMKAKVTDAFNNPVKNVLVTFNAPAFGASGSFASGVNTATTDSTGTATASQFTANFVAGQYTVSATASGIGTPAQFSLTNMSGAAASIAVSAGSPQSTTVNSPFATSLAGVVRDAQNNPVVGAVVTFSAPLTGSSARFPGDSTSVSRPTNASGVATAPVLTANSIAGTYSTTASVSGVASAVSFNLTNNPGNAASITTTAGTPQSAQINTAFVTNLQVTIRDTSANPVSNVSVTFTAPGTGPSGTFQGGLRTFTGQTNASGVLNAPTFTANSTSGAYTVSATVSGIPTPGQFQLTNTPGTAASVTSTQGNGQATRVLTAFATNLQVLVLDGSSNPVPNVTVTFTTPLNGASGRFSNGLNTFSVNTIATGLATAASLFADSIAGTYNVSASVAGVPTPALFSLTNTPGLAASVVATAGTPQSTTVNTAFATSFQAIVKDASGNPVQGVTITFTSPSTGASGTFAGGAGTYSGQTNASGIVVTSQFKANTVAGTYPVNAAVSGVPAPALFALTNTPGIAASVTVSGGGTQSTVVGTLFATNLQVVVRDSFSNPLSNVNVTFTSPTSGATSTFNPNPTSTNSNGVAQTTARAGTVVGSYSCFATVSGVAPAQFSLTNLPGAPKRIITLAGSSQSAQVGTAFSTSLKAAVRDTFDNPIANLTVTYLAPTTGPTGTFTGGMSTVQIQTDLNGGTSAPTFTANTTPGTYDVRASVSGIVVPALFTLTNLTGPPGSISPTQGTPQTTTVGSPFVTRFKATVRDAANNPLQGVSVSFSRPATGASGGFTGDSVGTTDVNGIAEANVFTANSIAGTYNVTATAPGVSNPATYNLTNIPRSAKVLIASGGSSQAAQIGTAFVTPLQVTVKDTFGNAVSGITVRFVRPTSGPSGSFAGNVDTARTGTNGIAMSQTFVANLIAGSYSVSATVTGLTPADFQLTNTAAQPGSIAVSTGNSQTTQINTAFAIPLGAIVRDAANNPVPGVEVTFTPPSNGPGGTFRNGINVVVTNANGIAVADTFTANAMAGMYEIVALAPGVSSSARFGLTNSPSSAASIVVVDGTPQTAQVNTAFASRFRALVRDASNNPVRNIQVTFTAPATGASGMFDGNVNTSTTNDSGIAIARIFTANAVAGSYIVNASIQGIPLPAGFNLTNSTGAPGMISVNAGGSQQTTVNTAFDTTLAVRVVDGSGNPVDSIQVTFTAPSSGATGTFANGLRTLTVRTNSQGRATASIFTANTIAGSYTVMASAPGVSTPAVFALTNKPGALSRYILQSTAGGNIPAQFVIVPFDINVTAKDTFGNTLSAYNGTVVISSTGMLLSGAGTSFPFVNGVVTHHLTYKKAGSNITITAKRTSGTEVGTSNSFAVNNPSPTLTSISPLRGNLLETLTLTVRGTNFIDSVTTLNVGAGIAVNSIVVDSSSQLRANISISANSTAGQRNVIVSNSPPGGGTSSALTFMVDIPTPTPPPLAGPPDASGNQRTTLRLAWGSSPLSLLYHLQISTEASFASTVFNDSTITDTSRVVGPPEIQNGTTYFWRVRGINTRGAGEFTSAKSFSTIPAYPQSFTLSASIPYATKNNPGDYFSTEYRIVGLPGTSNASVSSYLTGTNKVDWVAYWDNGTATNNFISFDGSADFNFSTGRAFWILRKGQLTISSTVPSATLDSATNSVAIPLHDGWNLITNPFTVPIPWSVIQTLNGSNISPIYKYEGVFSIASSLDPYAGYYFFKDPTSPISSLKVPFGSYMSSLAKSTKTTTGWKVSIGLTAEGFTDNTTTFGILLGSKPGLDSLEYRKPRAIGEATAIRFTRPEWDATFSAFATDFRPSVGDIQVWKFDVQTPVRQRINLNFDGIQAISTDLKVFLINEQQETYSDLREHPAYEFVSPVRASKFSVVVGREDKVQEVLNKVGPKEFSLGANFPNPFNPSTTIPVSLPQSSDVSITIYNILGETVQTIYSGNLGAGKHFFTWDGRNKSGVATASGMYIVRFTTSAGKAFSSKMILLK